MILFINASPKLKMSNSEYFINLLNIKNKKINRNCNYYNF